MSISVRIEGLDALRRKLATLPLRVERNVMRRAVAAGAAVIRDEARTRAPVYHGDVAKGHPPPGTLKKAIWQKFIPEASRNGRTVFYVGVRRGKLRQQIGKSQSNQDAYYWWFVEFGTSKMAAKPFLRPAFDSRKEQATTAIAAQISQGIATEALR